MHPQIFAQERGETRAPPPAARCKLYICCRTLGRRPTTHSLQRWRSRGSRSLSFVLDDARFDAADVAHVAPRLPRFRGAGREIARTRVEPFRGFPGDHTPKPLPGERASNLATSPVISPVPGSPEPASCKIMTSLTSQHMLQPKIALRGSRPSHATPSTESSASAYFSRNCRRTSSSAFHMPRPAASSSRARTFR